MVFRFIFFGGSVCVCMCVCVCVVVRDWENRYFLFGKEKKVIGDFVLSIGI